MLLLLVSDSNVRVSFDQHMLDLVLNLICMGIDIGLDLKGSLCLASKGIVFLTATEGWSCIWSRKGHRYVCI